MGLGLATVYSIINRHDGIIAIESKVGVGTTVFIYLPAYGEKIPDIVPLKILMPEKPTAYTGRVLLMDDEEQIRKLITQMITRMGYEIESAANGAETLVLYKEAIESGIPFDVVILDLTIKGGSGGKEIIKQLKKINPSVKAIVSSGYSNDPIMADFRRYGFEAALPKPVIGTSLKATLSKIIKGEP